VETARLADNVRDGGNVKQPIILIALAICLFAIGCGPKQVYTDAQGNTVSVERGSGDVTVHTKDGDYRSTQDGKTMTVSSKDGNMTMNSGISITEVDLGLPLYPGSQDLNKGSIIERNGQKTVTTLLSTADSPKQVLEFYKGKFGTVESSSDAADFTILTGKSGGRRVMMQASRAEGKTSISLTSMP
jgi:hypothetical protein